ncbi:MAG: tyrosine-type recombinase/integrase [Nitrospirae bacterium]|nr:tyrosine-type recombinase/integrase [Nitrospirota bacterium]
MRPNPIAPWELRINNLRVYYDIEDDHEHVVYIRAVGIKERNNVRIGKEVIKHRTHIRLPRLLLLMNGINIREIQELLGHKNIETTMIYTHVIRDMSNVPKSPIDSLYVNRDVNKRS